MNDDERKALEEATQAFANGEEVYGVAIYYKRVKRIRTKCFAMFKLCFIGGDTFVLN